MVAVTCAAIFILSHSCLNVRLAVKTGDGWARMTNLANWIFLLALL